jgi:hypothetical protein
MHSSKVREGSGLSGTTGDNYNSWLRKQYKEGKKKEAENRLDAINTRTKKKLADGRKSRVYKSANNFKKLVGITPTPWADARKEATREVDEEEAEKRKEERKYLGFENPLHGGKTKKNRNKKNNTKRRR